MADAPDDSSTLGELGDDLVNVELLTVGGEMMRFKLPLAGSTIRDVCSHVKDTIGVRRRVQRIVVGGSVVNSVDSLQQHMDEGSRLFSATLVTVQENFEVCDIGTGRMQLCSKCKVARLWEAFGKLEGGLGEALGRLWGGFGRLGEALGRLWEGPGEPLGGSGEALGGSEVAL